MKKNKVLVFFVRVIGCYVAWLLLYHYTGLGVNGLESYFTNATGWLSSEIINLFGQESNIRVSYNHIEKSSQAILQLRINGVDKEVVSIGAPCNGLSIIAVYIGFIVCYFGSLSSKISFALAGTVIIFLSNSVRVIALAYNHLYSIDTFDFNHKYTYTFLVYGIVFILWMVWVNRYSYLASKYSKLPEKHISYS